MANLLRQANLPFLAAALFNPTFLTFAHPDDARALLDRLRVLYARDDVSPWPW